MQCEEDCYTSTVSLQGIIAHLQSYHLLASPCTATGGSETWAAPLTAHICKQHIHCRIRPRKKSCKMYNFVPAKLHFSVQE